MISCHGLCYRQRKTFEMLASSDKERPVSFQIFGADPHIMGEAAAILSSYQPDLIDINMGCPAKKVTKRGAGAALMANPSLAEEIILNVVKRSTVPVTVKIRAGVSSNELNGIEFARMTEAAGASAVTVHGRTWTQGFTGTSDTTIISRIKQTVSIPVIGNGDILSYQDGMAMLSQTGCDGVMIGRGALGNPWVFRESGKPLDLQSILQGVLRHMELIEQHLNIEHTLGVVKNHIGRYFKNLQGSAQLRKAVYDSPSFSSLKDTLQNLASSTIKK